MEIDILTGSILIGLFLTNVILIFLDSRQRKAFRYTEMQLQNALLDTETRLQDALLKDSRQQSKFRQTRDQTTSKINCSKRLKRSNTY